MYNTEWLNLNANRRFPFTADASLNTYPPFLALSNGLVLDALLMMSQDYQSNFYLSTLVWDTEEISLVIARQDGAEALIGTGLHNSTITVIGKEDFLGSYGKVTVGDFTNFPPGKFKFIYSGTQFEPCRVLKLNHGVSAINGISQGNVILASGTNVVITKAGNTIKIDTYDGLCACDDLPCIKTINGIPPINNNFTVDGIGCVSVIPGENGVKIINDCEDACCGCDEVNDMITRIRALEQRIINLETS